MDVNYLHAAQEVLVDTSALISLPSVCLKLRELMADPMHTREQVVRLILHDQALTTRILKVVNSAYYALPYRVSTINQALNILGEEELKNLVIVTSIVRAMAVVDSHMDIRKFWRSSVLPAVLARNLGADKGQGKELREELFICGLLLNIGSLLLYYWESGLLHLVREESRTSGRPQHEIEREQIGFSHTDVGRALAYKWQFPEVIAESVATHHELCSNEGPANPVMFAVSVICKLVNNDPEQLRSFRSERLEKLKLAESLNLSHGQFTEAMHQSSDSFDDIRRVFQTEAA